MSSLVISSAVWFGYELTTAIVRNRFAYLVRIAIGIAFGIAFQSFVFFVTSLFYPLNEEHGVFGSSLFGIVSIVLACFNQRFKPSRQISYTVGELITLVLSLFLVMWGSYVVNMEDGYHTRGPAYADLPFHLNIISSFSQGINYNRTSIFDVWSVFQADIHLAYPMFHNFYVACLINCGDIKIKTALQIPAMVLSFSFIILLYEVFVQFSKDRVVSVLSIVTWFFLGGLGWTVVFYPDLWKHRACNWILRFSSSHNAVWMQNFVQILLPQRSALFSAPLCLSCILCFFRGVKHFEACFFLLAGLCTGFLPQLQVHSFVAVAQFAIATCLIWFPSRKNFWKVFFRWAMYGLVSCLIGLPLTYPFWIRRAENSLYFIKLTPIWSDDVYGKLRFPLISVWWKGLGPFGVIMYLMGWVSANPWQMKFWGSAMLVWLLTSFIRYQPWLMDNLKLLFAVWTPIAVPYVTQFYVWVWRRAKSGVIKGIVAFLFVQGLFSGILSYNSELLNRRLFITPHDYTCGQWIAENTPVDAIFMSYSSRFNPASSFAGRQLYLGFISWIAQHGVHGPNRELKMTELLADNNNADAFAREGVGYVLVRNNETLKFPLKSDNTAWSAVFTDGPYVLYRLNHDYIAPPEHKRDNTTDYAPPTPEPTPSRRRKRRK